MKVFASNWLINMGIVGFLRILEYSGTNINDLFNNDGSIDVNEELLENFGHKYLAYSVYKFTEDHLDDLCYNENLEKIKSAALESLNQKLSDIKETISKKDKKTKALKNHKKAIKKIIEKLESFPNQFNWLLNYYPNLNLIANPSSKTKKRAEMIESEYIQPAIETINSTKNDGELICSMCSRNNVSLENKENNVFSKSLFSPLGVSPNSFLNYFYNFKPHFYVCDLCKLFLICSYAGLSKKPYDPVDKTNEVFINLAALGIEELYSINQSVKAIKALEKGETVYERIVELSLSGHIKRKSKWSLENIQFIEMLAKPQKETPSINMYSVSPDIARLFADSTTVSKNLRNITARIPLAEGSRDEGYMKYVVLKYLLNGKDLMEPVFLAMKLFVKSPGYNKWLLISSFNTIVLSLKRNSIRAEISGGDKNMVKKSNYGILKSYQEIGQKDFANFDLDKKKRMSYVLLSLIRNGKSEEFYEKLLKIYMNSDKEIPKEIVNLLTRSSIATFKEKAFAFMTGFLMGSNKKRETNNKNEGGNL